MHYDGDPSAARILELCDEILDCRTLHDMSDRVLAPVQRFLNATSTAFLQYRWQGGKPGVGYSATHAVDPHYHSLYDQHYFRQDPVVDRARPTNVYYDSCAGGQLEIFSLSDISDYRELERTAYYNEFFRPIRVHHVLAMCFRSRQNPDQVLGIGFHRPQSGTAFDHSDTRRARYIASTLLTKAQGLLSAAECERQSAVVDGLGTMTDGQGVILLDEAGTLLFTNHQARRDLNISAVVGQRVEPGHSPDMDRVLKSCRSLPRPIPGRSGNGAEPTAINVASDGSVRPMRLSIQALTGNAQKLRYLITTGSDNRDDLFAARMASLGLTRREADIVQLLAKGLSNPDIGRQLCISVRTVENHLRSIYAKADVQSRTQLIGRLISET